MKYLLFSTLFVLLLVSASAQIGSGGPSKAERIVHQAIELVDQGKLDEGLKLLQEAKSLDPEDYNIDYEIAFVYSQQKKYKKAIAIYEEVIDKHSDASDQFYQMLGNAYDMNGQPEKALVAYQRGINKYPQSGKLYSEMAIVHAIAYNNISRAVDLWEEGVKAEPTYPTNYYWLAKVFCQTDNPGWGLLYGEIFMNMQPSSPRADELSKLMYDTWDRIVTVTNDTSIKYDFFKLNFNPNDVAQMLSGKMPFNMLYSLCLTAGGVPAALSKTKEGLEYYSAIQKGGMEKWFADKNNETYPNIVLDWQQKVAQAGHFSAYSQWMIRKGNPEAFKAWLDSHKPEFDAFVDWFKENDIPITETTYFSRVNYLSK